MPKRFETTQQLKKFDLGTTFNMNEMNEITEVNMENKIIKINESIRI